MTIPRRELGYARTRPTRAPRPTGGRVRCQKLYPTAPSNDMPPGEEAARASMSSAADERRRYA